MQIMSLENFFIILMSFHCGIFVFLVSILVMQFLMPKIVLETYFKPPYFSIAECAFFSGIPYSPIRTAMLMRCIGFPESGKVRGMMEAYTLVPLWYRKLSKLFVIFLLVNAFSLLVMYVITGVVIYLRG